jgi:ribulose-phosphate 3-epimerase
MSVLLAPSILSADFTKLGEEAQRVEAAGADWLHVDVMDGRFVPNISLGVPVVASLARVARRPLDVHLMMVEPDRYVDAFADAGATGLTVHVEAVTHLQRCLTHIQDRGLRAGVAINPGTSVAALDEIVHDAGLILVMSVNPGFGGQAFLERATDRVARVRALLDAAGSSALIEVDGGIDPDTAPRVVAAGADVLVAGAAVFGQPDVSAAMAALRAAADVGLARRGAHR